MVLITFMKIKLQQNCNTEDLEYDIISERVYVSFLHKLGNVKLISCLALRGKKIIFGRKRSMREKEFSFYFIKLSWKRCFYERIAVSLISR